MKFKHLFLIATILLLSSSCSLKLAPSRDDAVIQKVTTAMTGNIAIYDKAMGSSDKRYVTYESDYGLIEPQIES